MVDNNKLVARLSAFRRRRHTMAGDDDEPYVVANLSNGLDQFRFRTCRTAQIKDRHFIEITSPLRRHR